MSRRSTRRHAGHGQPPWPRGNALPTPEGEAGLAALPELGYALFEIGEVDEASAVLAGARERARADGERHWSGGCDHRARIEMYRDPGDRSGCAVAETETAIEVLGEFGDEAGLAARGWFSPTSSGARAASRTSDAAGRAAEHARRTGNRREVGWALGQIALCAIHGLMTVVDGLSPARAIARSGA